MTTTSMTKAIWAACLGGIFGCKETTSSANIETPGIAAAIYVSASASDVSKITARLQVGGTGITATYVDLEGGDRIFASADDDRQEMQPESTGVYQAAFATTADGTEFVVELEREDHQDAPDSRGTLPAPFEIDALQDETFSRADDAVQVTWTSSSGDSLELTVASSPSGCFPDYSELVPGSSGVHTIPGGTFESSAGAEKMTCEATVGLRRSSEGTPDPILDPDSFMILEQTRSTTFTSVP